MNFSLVNRKIAIMQPYFFPYIGYWQLINSADKFVIFDDVNYKNRGWINRNYILNQNIALRITLETLGSSSNKLINEIDVGNNIKTLIKTINHAYYRAKNFDLCFPLIYEILSNKEKKISIFLANAIQTVCNFLDIKTEILISSSLAKKNDLKGVNKILNICELLGASMYVNSIGGKALYSEKIFLDRGFQLRFLSTNNINYSQNTTEFIPNLSIIDMMMFNPVQDIKKFLLDYSL